MQRIDRYVRIVENAAAVAIIFAMVAVVALQVVFRYFLAAPLSWSQEIAEALLVWTTLLGMAIAQRDHAHIAMHLFPSFEHAFVVRLIAWLAMVLLFGTLAFGGTQLVMQHAMQESPVLRIPYWEFVAMMPIAALLGLWHLAFELPWRKRDAA